MKKLKLLNTTDSKVYFTSDTHYGHKNICKGVTSWEDANDSTRDFDTLEEMNEWLIHGINLLVKRQDILIHLGDWSFGGFENIRKFRERIWCENIHLVLGNHDHHIENNREGIQDIFTSVSDMLEIEINYVTGGQVTATYMVQACHYPMMSWKDMNKGAMHLHGHVHLPGHNKHAGEGRIMDVGVDANGMLPVAFRAIAMMLKDREPVSSLPFPDHHSKNIR